MSTVSATSSTTASSGSSNHLAQIAQDLQVLAAALKKGDKKAAAAAMLQLQIDSAAGSSSSSSSGAGAADLAKVASALQSEDMTTAQKNFATFENHAAAAAQKSPQAADGTDTLTSSETATTDQAGSTLSVLA